MAAKRACIISPAVRTDKCCVYLTAHYAVTAMPTVDPQSTYGHTCCTVIMTGHFDEPVVSDSVYAAVTG